MAPSRRTNVPRTPKRRTNAPKATARRRSPPSSRTTARRARTHRAAGRGRVAARAAHRRDRSPPRACAGGGRRAFQRTRRSGRDRRFASTPSRRNAGLAHVGRGVGNIPARALVGHRRGGFAAGLGRYLPRRIQRRLAGRRVQRGSQLPSGERPARGPEFGGGHGPHRREGVHRELHGVPPVERPGRARAVPAAGRLGVGDRRRAQAACSRSSCTACRARSTSKAACYNNAMPAWNVTLTDRQIAQVLSYVRGKLGGNSARPSPKSRWTRPAR